MGDPAASRRSAIGGVVFDLDGTLVDSCEDIAAAVNHCLERAGFPARSVTEVRSFVGDGVPLLLARASGLSDADPRLAALLESFFVYYTAHAIDRTVLLPGVREVLAELAHLPLAVCTNKPRVMTLAMLDGLGVAAHFAAVVAAGDATHNKPHPAPLERVSQLLGVPCERLVLVGDGPQDIACARAAGARSIGISEALIVPIERLRAAAPDAIVPLREVPARIARWQTGGD
jgi:2-phosphoglycolate phosphatase